MDLNYSEEQNMLRASLERFVGETYQARDKSATAQLAYGFDPAIWRQFADLGWLALPLPEAADGLGGGAVDIGVVMEAFGRGPVSEPYVSTIALCSRLIARLGAPQQQRDLLARVGAGALRLSLAHEESRWFSLEQVATRAVRDGDGWRLDGAKHFALDAAGADALLVTARIGGAERDAGGVGVFVVPADAPGLTLTAFERLGGGSGARVRLEGVRLGADALLGDSDNALPAVEAAVDAAIAALCAEAVGMMQAVLDKTVEYTKTRVQFGQPLAANQVLKHRMADMAIACEEARSLALRAALHVDLDGPQRGAAVSGAKAKIGRLARFVAEQGVQLHGGMGVTDELDIGVYLKRVMAFDALFGDSAHHLRRRAALTLAA